MLTVNNGRYYIDMTQSENYQRQSKELTPRIAGTSRFINLFERDKSYYVFFVFAKPTTHQMYQFYVGSGFDPGSIKGVRVNISGAPNSGSFTEGGLPWTATMDDKLPQTDSYTNANYMSNPKGYQGNPNVVDIDVDFSKIKQDDENTNLNPKNLAADDTCQPHNYCSKESGKCVCNKTRLGVLGLLDKNYLNVCNNVCGKWAVKDLDCPKGGVPGIQDHAAGRLQCAGSIRTADAPAISSSQGFDADGEQDALGQHRAGTDDDCAGQGYKQGGLLLQPRQPDCERQGCLQGGRLRSLPKDWPGYRRM